MISIIISYTNSNYLNQLKENIAETIGTTYEILDINNSNARYSLAEAYNKEAKKAIYPILCFIHEDILFHTPDWGIILSGYFENEKTGLVGIAGSVYKTRTITGWGNAPFAYRMNLIQSYKYDAHTGKQHIHSDFHEKKSEKVACVDGVFLATRKTVWEDVRFDEKTFRKFHCYDIDYSLSVLSHGLDVLVTYEILLEHFSEGNFDKTWYEESIQLHKKWKKTLPLGVTVLSNKEKKILEWEGKKLTTEILVKNGYNKADIIKNILSDFFPFSFSRFFHCVYLLFSTKQTM